MARGDSLVMHTRAERLVELLRDRWSDNPIKREDVALAIGVDLRTLRRIRELAELISDFPISYERGYCRLTPEEVAAEIAHRNACKHPYRHLIDKARPNQEAAL